MTEQTTPPAIAEIVTFKLSDTIGEADFIALIARTNAYASACPGFISRDLSRGSDGVWTDHILWNSLSDAQTAAAGFMQQDFAPEMGAAIAPGSMSMRHQDVLFQSP